jgi:preflagellin peptidase FlaK
MYMSGALKGGADVKALVSLCMLYPVYPGFGGSVWVPVYPAAYVFNPVFSTLLIALVLSFAFLIPVIARGRKVSATYETEISDARRRHVWPVEDIQGGLRVPVRPQDDPGDVYSRLEEAGYDRVRVTPMVPFVLPITAAFIITILAGSPLFGLLEICLYS